MLVTTAYQVPGIDMKQDSGKPSGLEVIILSSCSAQLSMKFKMLINIEIAQIN